jgi:hypothetical protein
VGGISLIMQALNASIDFVLWEWGATEGCEQGRDVPTMGGDRKVTLEPEWKGWGEGCGDNQVSTEPQQEGGCGWTETHSSPARPCGVLVEAGLPPATAAHLGH